MDINNEFYTEVLSILDKNQVEFILVGGIAVGIHGYARYTGDMDLWLNPTSENMTKLKVALVELEFEEATILEIIEKRAVNHPTPIRLFDGKNEFQVDLMTTIYNDNFTWEFTREHAQVFFHKTIPVPVIHINHLITIKETIQRADDSMKDLVDAQELKKIRDRSTNKESN